MAIVKVEVVGGIELSFEEDIADTTTTGSTVWPACLALVQFLNETVRKRRKSAARWLELGSGCGVVGLAALAMGDEGTRVVLTDKEAVLPLLRRNVARNTTRLDAVRVEHLNWGTDVTDLHPPFDFVVASDCVYMAEDVSNLVKTMRDVSDGNTTLFISLEIRCPVAFDLFMKEVEDSFTVKRLKTRRPVDSNVLLYSLKQISPL